MKKILVIIEKGLDGKYSAYTPNLKTTVLNGQGNSVDEAVCDMKVSLKEVVETYQDSDDKVPDEISEPVEFIYKYDVQSLFNYFDEINITAFSQKVGINASLLRQYKNGLSFASDRQIEKIKRGLHELGSRLISIR
ncbi:MAG: type II toxin-antitoxin system HicB family antitoxin [Prolixibacteraceae bacterium]|nr:type II toxin-antitoxin system HicB family antitoxin [Prolixibacteraceae bacterium]